MKKMTFFTLTLLVFSTLSLQTAIAQDTLEGHGDYVGSVLFSPDGTILASASSDGTVKLWDVATRTNIATLRHGDFVYSVLFSPDGTTLASAGDGTVKLWDVATKQNIATLRHGDYVYSVLFSPDGTTLASPGDGTVKLWDVATKQNIATLDGNTAYVFSVAFSPDGTLLASGGGEGFEEDGTVKLWDVATGTNIATLQGHTDLVWSVLFSPDGTILTSASSDGTVKLWDVATGTNIATLEHPRSVSSVLFSPDGTTLASAGGSVNGTVKLWDVATKQNIATLRHGDYVNSVSFSPDGTLLATGSSWSYTVELWDVATKQNIATFEGHGDYVLSVSFSPDGTTLASGSLDNTVKLWNIAELTSTLVKISGDDQQGTPGAALAHPLAVEVRDWSNNPVPGVEVTFTVTDGGGQLGEQFTVEHAMTDANGQAELTLTLGPNLGTNTVEVTIAGHEPVTFHAEGILILVKISGDNQQDTFGSTLANPLVVEVRDRDNNPLPGVEVTFTVTYGEGLLNGRSTVAHVTTDANGRASRTFTLGSDSTITNTVEVSIGPKLVTFHAVGISPYQITAIQAHADDVYSVAFSPDGTILASGGSEGWNEDGTVKLWDVATKQNTATFVGHTDDVTSVAFSPDGTTLASGSGDNTVKVWDVATKQNIATLKGHTDAVTSVAFSPDGTTLASGGISGDTSGGLFDFGDGEVKLWDVETKQNIATLEGHESPVISVSFSPDGTLLVSASLGRIKLWDVATRENIATLEGHTRAIWDVAFSPDGKTLASGSLDGTVKLWDVETKQNIATFMRTSWVASVSFSPDGTTLASGLGGGGVLLWDMGTREIIAALHTGGENSVSFSPDGKTLASGSFDGKVKLWDMAEAKSPQPAKLAKISGEAQQGWMGIPLPNPLVVEVRDQYNNLNPGGQVEFSVTEGGGKLNGQSDFERVTADADGRARISLTLGHTLVNTVEATPLGVSLAQNQSVVFTITLSPYIFSSLQAHSEAVYDLSLSPDGKTLATGSLDNTVKLWDMETKEYIGTLEGHSNYINAVSFSPDGMRLASCSRDNTVRLWDMETHTEIATLGGHERSVLGVAFSLDGTRLASGGRAELNDADGQVKLWDVETQTNIATLEGHTGLVWSVAFSPDGKTLATVSSDATVKLWDVDTQTNITTLEGHEDSVLSVAFSLDGKTLTTGSSDNTVKLWDVATRTNIATLEGHTGTVWSVAFSSDGKTLATASSDATVKLWDVDTQTNIAILEEHTQIVWSVAFSPDGKTLISGSGDGAVKFWDMSSIFTSLLTPNSLAADVNGDGVVNMADMVLVASNYGQTGENAADINGDGIVHIYDILLVAAQINTNGAAPALHAKNLSKITSADIEKWLTDAQQLDITDATSLKGILFLEQLLTALTPKETALLANFPNPFNPETWIPYQLAKPADVTLTIYAMNGQVVRQLALGHQAAGMYQNRSRAAYWDGRNALGEPVASGIYFYTLTAGDFTATRKMLIRK